MNLTRSSAKLFGANIIGAAVQFLGITYFARELGAATMGAFFLFEALLGILSIPADFGLLGAVEKRISEGKYRGTFLTSAVLLKAFPILVIVLLVLIFRPWVNSYLGADIAIHLAVTIVLQEAARLSITVLKGELRVEETALIQTAHQLVWIGVSVLFVSLGYNVVGLIYGLLAGFVVMTVWGWYKVSVPFGSPSRKHAKSLFNYGKFNVISSLGGYSYSWMDVAIIGLFLSQAHVGAYEIAWRITAVVMLLSEAIATAIFPRISEWGAEGAHDRIEAIIPTVLTPSLILAIPAFFGTLLYSKEILRLVFGPEYMIAWLALVVLMFDKVTEAAQVIFGRSLQALDRPDLAARATLIAVFLNLILNLVLVWKFGITGAAIATMVASLIGGVGLHTWYLSSIITIKIPTQELLGCIFAAVGMTVALLSIGHFIAVESVLKLSFFIGLGALIYGLLLLITPPIRTRLVQQLHLYLGS